MHKYITFTIIALLLSGAAMAQDTTYVRRTIQTLASPSFKGRGYAFHGDSIAAQYLSKQMYNMGLETWYPNYQQPYTVNVNKIGNHATVNFGKSYKATCQSDMLKIDPCSATTKGKFSIVNYADVQPGQDYSHSFICVDMTLYKGDTAATRAQYRTIYHNPLQAKGYVVLEDRVRTASPGTALHKANHCIVYLIKDSLLAPLTTVKVNLDAQWESNYTCQNIVGYVLGTHAEEDIWIVIGAHYDHLGMMGKNVIYPGAQDNASGTATVLDMARYLSMDIHRPFYNTAFVLFDGEESGLLGSSHFVKHCPIAAENIKMMINLDLTGNGEEGICICGGEDFPEEYDKMLRINEENQYLPDIQKRNVTPNSDHYPFFKAGCPAIFIYTRGASGPYHHPHDLPQYLSLAGYNGLFKLLIDYMNL